VLAVAKANHIADPNRIYAGQQLDMSSISGSAAGQEAPDASTTRAAAPPWHTLVGGASALSSEFGVRQDPFTGQVKQHQGIDVLAPSGAPVAAFEAGKVIFSGWKPGYGTTVILRHEDGLESIYGHLSRSLVKVGEMVASHAPIARVGASGHATGAHLHFEVRSQGRATDPLALLKELLPQTTQPGVVLSEGQVGSPSGAPDLVLPPRTSRLAQSQLGYSNL
jgi:murein DD-endopeptidase MepM/ murein hydrolase activator NlpD